MHLRIMLLRFAFEEISNVDTVESHASLQVLIKTFSERFTIGEEM